MICPKCSKNIDDDSIFCSKCGAFLSKANEENTENWWDNAKQEIKHDINLKNSINEDTAKPENKISKHLEVKGNQDNIEVLKKQKIMPIKESLPAKNKINPFAIFLLVLFIIFIICCISIWSGLVNFEDIKSKIFNEEKEEITLNDLNFYIPKAFTVNTVEKNDAYFTIANGKNNCSIGINTRENSSQYSSLEAMTENEINILNEIAYDTSELKTKEINNTTWAYFEIYNEDHYKNIEYRMINNYYIYEITTNIYKDNGTCSSSINSIISSLKFNN
ncbi:MAG: zinc ribbon domain-containing protein [Bacilli bacterium]|nr:zinc ribbon domain-containing protein [Bacilli bacterium]